MMNLILFGPPGSGKGTQAAKLVDEFGLLHISTGDLFRYHLKNDTELGREAKRFMDAGQLVPDAVTIKMLQDKVEENPDTEGIIFDGFPRTINQAVSLDEFLTARNSEIHALIQLDVSEEEIVARLLERGKTSGRADDRDETIIRRRYQEYLTKTAPVFDHYAAQDKATKVAGIGSVDKIFGRLAAEVGKLSAKA